MGVRLLRSSISISLVFHLVFLLVVGFLAAKRTAQHPASKPIWIELEKPPATKPQAQDERFRKQIVQTEKGREVAKPLPDSFLGERNQAVDRETVSKARNTLMGKSTNPAQAEKPDARTHSPNHEQQLAEKPLPNVSPLSNLGLAIIPRKIPTKPQATPDSDDRPWVEFGNLPQDYVKGLKEGERTALNTKEFVFYGYFQRIRERLDRAWVPILRERLVKLYNQGRQLASDMDHTTRVLVVLNLQGEIVRVVILSESGTADLDAAAVSAFNQAGPFPNPPHGIEGTDGLIQIPWEFILRT